MPNKLSSPVGQNARNTPDDVKLVQAELNKRAGALRLPQLSTNGLSNPALVRAIRRFQRCCMATPRPDGRIQPGGQTERALFDDVALGRQIAAAAAYADRMSGADWWHANQARYPNSASVSDLAPAFAENAQSFVTALRRAGANVAVNATRRNRIRAYLMHYSWQVARGAVPPNEVPREEGVEIEWDHDNVTASREAAREMVELFDIAYKPSLKSNHIRGTAIDMTIDWTDPIEVVDGRGRTQRVDRPRSGATNTTLHEIGASYGVHKLLSDPPHWSSDGH